MKKKMVFLFIIMLVSNMVIPSQGSLSTIWSDPLDDLWVDIFAVELDRDFDSNMDTAFIYQRFSKTEQDYDVLMNFTSRHEVYYFNSSDTQLFTPSSNWKLISNRSDFKFLRPGTIGRADTYLITVESFGVIRIKLHLNINNKQEGHFNWTSENLSVFNETLRELNLEKNSTLRFIDQTGNENQFDRFPVIFNENEAREHLIIPRAIWWFVGIVAIIMIGLIIRRPYNLF